MARALTIAALLPALGAATAAWAQADAYPAPAHAAYGAAPQTPRPAIIPHGGYPWRIAPPGGRQLTPAQAWGAPSPIPAPPPSANSLTPAPDLRPVTSHPDATFRPYVAPTPAPTSAPTPAPTSASRPAYPAPAPAPWTRPTAPAYAPAYAATPDRSAPPPPAALQPPPPEPAPTEFFAAEPVAAPAPTPQPMLQPEPQPQPQLQSPPPPPAAEPTPAPSPQPAAQPEPQTEPQSEPQSEPQPGPQTEPQPDPMAPRRDALIFQLQRPQPAAAAPAADDAAPAENAPTYGGGARYYSVHRQAGRQPDATPLPAPVYLDAMPVELDQTPASTDLAAPPEAPTLIRDAAGRLRAAPPIDDPMLP